MEGFSYNRDVGVVNGNNEDIESSEEYYQQFHNKTNTVNEGVEPEKDNNNKRQHVEGRYLNPLNVSEISQNQDNSVINPITIKVEIEDENTVIKEETIDIEYEQENRFHELVKEEYENKCCIKFEEEVSETKFHTEIDLGKFEEEISSNEEHSNKTTTELKKKRNTEKYLNIYHCNHCSFLTKSRMSMRTHVKKIHTKPNCTKKDFSTKYIERVKQTITPHPKVGVYKCDYCDYRATYKAFIKSHCEAVHMDVKKYTCQYCSFKTDRKATMENHIDGVHIKLKKHMCTRCDYGTYHYPSLKRHLDIMHAGEHTEETNRITKCYKCERCDFTASSYATVQNHNDKVHLGIESFDCEHCDFKAFCRATVKAHTDIFHKKVEKLKCVHCDYRSNFTKCIQRHVKTVHRNIKKEQFH